MKIRKHYIKFKDNINNAYITVKAAIRLSACVCDESYEKSTQANLSFGFATKSLLYQMIVNFNSFYYQVCATTIDLRSLFFILSHIITPIRQFCFPLEASCDIYTVLTIL